ncbi:MAG: HNH endonuclease [Patescibacteria group bacterium]|nr:HNH endonuclease [Patescibacteria group bacterium]
MPEKPKGKCLTCNKETPRAKYKYCSNACQIEYQYQSYIRKWKAGEVNGLQGLGIVSGYIKRYLRRKFGDKCCLCGWSKINSKTGQAPLVADHIDGNWRNNVEGNLRLLCPNCDSLTPTYAGLNRGNGRKGRVLSKRAKEGRLLVMSRRSNSVVE